MTYSAVVCDGDLCDSLVSDTTGLHLLTRCCLKTRASRGGVETVVGDSLTGRCGQQLEEGELVAIRGVVKLTNRGGNQSNYIHTLVK